MSSTWTEEDEEIIETLAILFTEGGLARGDKFAEPPVDDNKKEKRDSSGNMNGIFGTCDNTQTHKSSTRLDQSIMGSRHGDIRRYFSVKKSASESDRADSERINKREKSRSIH